MYYFAYGSNMSIARLRGRVPSAAPLGCHRLIGHDLRFHKRGKDGTAKCDAFCTSDSDDVVYGALFEIDPFEKPGLDRAEGLGKGYEEKSVTVTNTNGIHILALTYLATHIDPSLKPYSWYVNHVLVGAIEAQLPQAYIQEKIRTIESVEDQDQVRDARQRAIHR